MNRTKKNASFKLRPVPPPYLERAQAPELASYSVSRRYNCEAPKIDTMEEVRAIWSQIAKYSTIANGSALALALGALGKIPIGQNIPIGKAPLWCFFFGLVLGGFHLLFYWSYALGQQAQNITDEAQNITDKLNEIRGRLETIKSTEKIDTEEIVRNTE